MRNCTLLLALVAISLACPGDLLAQADDGEARQLQELQARITMLETALENRDAIIASLEAQLKAERQDRDRRIAGLMAIIDAREAETEVEEADAATEAPPPACAVVRVIDGDTIVVAVEGDEVTVRLIGVDTPETKHPSRPVEAFGEEASAFMTNLLAGETVRLVIDPQQGETDRYGRTLAYVYRQPDGLFVNAELVRQGYGHAYTEYPFRYMDDFQALEQAASAAGRGLWAADTEEATTAQQPEAPAPAASTPATETTTEQAEVTVYVTRTGSKYHRGSCSYLRRSRIAKTLSQAKAGGYGPCSRCNPPQ